MSYRILQQAAETRRSVYTLNKQLPLSAAETAQIVEHAVKHTPSAFNSQSTRVVVLFGAEHEKLWQFAENACEPSFRLTVSNRLRKNWPCSKRPQEPFCFLKTKTS